MKIIQTLIMAIFIALATTVVAQTPAGAPLAPLNPQAAVIAPPSTNPAPVVLAVTNPPVVAPLATNPPAAVIVPTNPPAATTVASTNPPVAAPLATNLPVVTGTITTNMVVVQDQVVVMYVHRTNYTFIGNPNPVNRIVQVPVQDQTAVVYTAAPAQSLRDLAFGGASVQGQPGATGTAFVPAVDPSVPAGYTAYAPTPVYTTTAAPQVIYDIAPPEPQDYYQAPSMVYTTVQSPYSGYSGQYAGLGCYSGGGGLNLGLEVDLRSSGRSGGGFYSQPRPVARQICNPPRQICRPVCQPQQRQQVYCPPGSSGGGRSGGVSGGGRSGGFSGGGGHSSGGGRSGGR